jgi:hypothetical protein
MAVTGVYGAQVLHMLRGSPSPGAALILKPDQDAFQPAPSAHVPHLSLGCVQGLLSRFAACGTTAYRCVALVMCVYLSFLIKQIGHFPRLRFSVLLPLSFDQQRGPYLKM